MMRCTRSTTLPTICPLWVLKPLPQETAWFEAWKAASVRTSRKAQQEHDLADPRERVVWCRASPYQRRIACSTTVPDSMTMHPTRVGHDAELLEVGVKAIGCVLTVA